MPDEINNAEIKEDSIHHVGNFKFKPYLKLLGWLISGLVGLSILMVLMMRWINPPTSSFMIQRSLSAWWNEEENFELHHKWTDYMEISPYIKVAVIASEDQRFPDHWGFDFEAIEEAIEEKQQGVRTRGASTITQQVAKNLFLWPNQSLIRKGFEAYFTLLLELFWSKNRILEVYLNIAEFGNSVYGVEAACQLYFNTSATSLDMSRSALLPTVLPSPKRMNLQNPSSYMTGRRDWILRYMFYLGNTEYLNQLE